MAISLLARSISDFDRQLGIFSDHQRTIFFGSSGAVTVAQLSAQVAELRSFIQCNPGQCWAVFASDAGVFLANLLALWLEQKTVFLPPDNCNKTLSEAQAEVHHCLYEGQWVQGGALVSEGFTAELVISTSGSTGRPSLIEKTHQQLSAEILVLENKWGDSIADCLVVSTVSHQHIYGLLFRLLWPFCCGHTFEASVRRYPEDVLASALENQRICLVSSPSHLQRLPEYLEWDAVRGHIQICFSSAGPLAKIVSHQAQSLLSCPIFEVYGSTETGGIAYRHQKNENIEQPWHAFDGVEIKKLLDGDVLCLRSSYLPNDEWYKSSDRVDLISNRHFHLLGRVDRIAKVEGKRVSLTQLEFELVKHEFVDLAKVFVLDGKRQQMCAVIRLNSVGFKQLELEKEFKLGQQLKRYLRPSFENVVLPRRWRFVHSMPEDAQGKTTQKALSELFKETNNATG